MPVHGTLPRKLRRGVSLQVNGGDMFDGAVIFLGETFVRITEEADGKVSNYYFDWAAIQSMKTVGEKEKE